MLGQTVIFQVVFSFRFLKRVLICGIFILLLLLFNGRYAPSKRWHIDTIMRVLTTVNHYFYLLSLYSIVSGAFLVGLRLEIVNSVNLATAPTISYTRT